MSVPAPPMASFWLLPAAEDEALLIAEIERLAARHGTQRFHPHLTILGDVPCDPATLAGQTRKIATAARAFSAPVADIRTGEAFYRSFYAAFEETADMRALRDAAETAFGFVQSPFLPHISLLYGAVDAAKKTASALDASQRWTGRTIRFDRIALTNSSNDAPIPEWRCVQIVPL